MKSQLAFVIIFISFLFSTNVYSQTFSGDLSFCDKDISRVPVRESGRIKPLFVSAEENIKFLVGKNKFKNLTRSQIYCLLSLKATGLNPNFNLTAHFEHTDVLKLFKLENVKSMAYPTLISKAMTVRKEYFQQKVDSSYKKALSKILSRIGLYKQITEGTHWTVPQMSGTEISWTPIKAALTLNPELKNVQGFLKIAEDYRIKHGDKVRVEHIFRSSHLPSWALLVSLLALACLVLTRNFNLVLSLAGVTVILQLILMVVRIYISGRAPITNMYETVMFSGFGALILALAIGHFTKEKIYVYVGLTYNMLTLMMMNFATSMLSENIGPLVPVLRDNFWLSTHVTTIILSYGALALSWILSNMILIKRRFGSITAKDDKYYNKLVYNCLKFGTVLLAAGIILGGVWADYSWGRFWGWDPKETWSLIVFLIYMAILHGKTTSWISNQKFIPLVAGAFMSVMMAWFGVNYILASGLHSYGFSQGGAVFLFTFFAIQTLILIVTIVPNKTLKNA